MNFHVYLWVGFNILVLAILALDLGLARRKNEEPLSTKEAIAWTAAWVAVSLAIGAAIGVFWHRDKALQFFTGYVIEYALSVDNLFVFLLIFSAFGIVRRWQHKLLFWGVLGAFVMRAGLILLGVTLVERFEWLFYFFGAFLLFTAVKMLVVDEEPRVSADDNGIVRFSRRWLPVAKDPPPGRFFIRQNGKRVVTSLFLVLLVVEVTDLLFAFDSIPAVLGVSSDRFILYSSNVCAVLGLRSLFFVISSLMEKLRYLKLALAVVLGFIGLKMVVRQWVEIPILISLAVIASVLALAVLASVLRAEPAAK